MEALDWLSVISLILALFCAVISYWAFTMTKRALKLQFNLDLLTKGNEMILKHPELLKFHDVDQEQLSQIGVTPTEFFYILNSFYSGQVFHYIGKPWKVELTEYRKLFLQAPKVYEAWSKIIRPKMMGESKYVKAIDKYYRTHKKNENG